MGEGTLLELLALLGDYLVAFGGAHHCETSKGCLIFLKRENQLL